MFDSHKFTRCSPYLFLNPPEYLAVQIFSRLLFWLATLAFIFPTIYTGAIYFCIFKSSALIIFVEILSFGFSQVSSECDPYLPIDHSLVYSHAQMFLLIFYLIFLELSLKPSLPIKDKFTLISFSTCMFFSFSVWPYIQTY